jgi:riboflavin biosynthesis pyrimidine reductase
VIDRIHTIVAPSVLGERGVKFFDGIDVPKSELITVKVDHLGPDTWMEMDVHGHR